MRSVHLHGKLGEDFGKVHQLDVRTAAEAVRALIANYPEITGPLRDGAWHIIRGDVASGMDLDEQDLLDFKLGKADLHIVPAIVGAKEEGGSGLLKIVLGVALVGAAFAFSGGALATPIMSTGLLSNVTWGNMAMIGAAVALAGVSQLLSPEENSSDENDASFLMSGPNNVGGQGSPVPLVYGELIAGTIPISAGITIENVPIGSSGDSGKGSSGLFGSKGGGK